MAERITGGAPRPREIIELRPAACGMFAPAKIAVRELEYSVSTDHWHRHCGFFELVLAVGGFARSESDGESVLLRSGNFMLYRPGSVHRFAAIRKFKHYNLFLEEEMIRSSRELFSAFAPVKNFLFDPEPVSPLYTLDDAFFPQMIAMLDALQQEYLHRSDGWLEAMFFDAGRLFVHLLRHGATDVPAVSGADWRIAEAVRFMESSLRNPLTIQSIARHVNMSESSFRHHFRDVIGCSPMEYLIRLRLKRAILLLMLKTPVSLVALQSGFTDLNYFCRQFHRHLGVTARSFRRSAESPDFDLSARLAALLQNPLDG